MIIIDNYIQNKVLFNQIKKEKEFSPKPTLDGSFKGKVMFWDGWWKSPANTVVKKVIKKIWNNFLPDEKEKICGFEYWIRTYTEGQFLSFHVDQDAHLYDEKKIFKGPIATSVYYPDLGLDLDGGFLEIHNAKLISNSEMVLEKKLFESNISPIENRERIAVKPNRLIIFDGGHTIHNATPVISGVKVMLAINVWHFDSPPHGFLTGQMKSN